jgi:phage terminase small subunit
MTIKQDLFIREYLKTWNATEAAINAGYSKRTAYSIGEENLKKPEIKEALEKLKKEILGDVEKDIIENVTFWMSIRDDKEAAAGARLKASELLGRYRSMFTDKVEHSGHIAVEIIDDIS